MNGPTEADDMPEVLQDVPVRRIRFHFGWFAFYMGIAIVFLILALYAEPRADVPGVWKAAFRAFGAASAFVFVIGAVRFLVFTVRSRRIADLEQNGQRVRGTIVGMRPPMYNPNNARHHWFRVVVRVEDPSGNERKYTSDMMALEKWHLLPAFGHMMQDRKTFDVLVDPNDSKRYDVLVPSAPALRGNVRTVLQAAKALRKSDL